MFRWFVAWCGLTLIPIVGLLEVCGRLISPLWGKHAAMLVFFILAFVYLVVVFVATGRRKPA